MDVEIELIGEDGVDTYIQYIPSVMISDIKEGKKLCFGLYGKEIGDDRKTYGSVVVSLDASIDGKEGNVLVVDAVTPEKLLCNHDIMTIVTGKLLEYIIHNDMLGMILSIVYPDMSDVESVFDMFNFIRLEDGNSIYEASIKELIKHKMFSKDLHDFDKYISSIEELSVSERNSFFKEMGTRYPEGLSPNHLPGKMLNGLSFIYKEHSEIKGFVLVSGISDELIYVGSLYNEGDPSYAAALLKCLAREVIRKTSYTKVMFAAATDSVKRFCDNLTYEIESLNKRWIRYYYLEVYLMGASFDETIAFSDDELYGAAVNVRTNGLIELIRDFADEAEISVGKNGFPCIDAIIAGVSYKMSYFPVGDVDTDRFILVIRTSVFKDDDKDDISKMLVCESYNAASVMGYAIYLPLDGSIEYRISIAERGGLSDSEYYRYVFEMAENSIEELVELLEENED